MAQAAAGLTNEELARELPVSLRLLQRWRSGDGQPSGANLARLCSVLDRPVEWFYGDTDVVLGGEAA